MNKKFIWKYKYNKYECLIFILLFIISLFVGNELFISFSATGIFYALAGLSAQRIRMKAGIKDYESSLSKKQMLFVFLLLALVILSIVLIKLFVADESLTIILICALALVSGVFALVYVMKAIRNNKK
ncbi:MAG: hypothetical protein LBK94_05480 [Prevotellaceae bacterium]|jgi:hypothetical protein|nr:hypothetical protein [Prevotellaceae bacterium]